MSDYSKNLSWYLLELANADLDDLETGEIEICGETEDGIEAFGTVNISDLCKQASNKIDKQSYKITKQDKIISDLLEFVGSTNPKMNDPKSYWIADMIQTLVELEQIE